jgi:CubicO group peptidase (beta-lactamase class C family)
MVMSERIDRVLDDLVKSGAAPGVAAIVINGRGPLYQGAAGTKGVGHSEPMTLDTVFWYASMTKALVAAGAMQLVEQGRLKLDEPASNILPQLASVQVLEGFEADGSPKLRPAKRPITPRQLLTHTAGFGYNWANGVILRYLQIYDLPDLIHCKRRSLDQPLLADPGDRWEYGISIDWIGQLIEAVSGQSLRDYLRKNLFDPLGMDDTDFIQTAAQKARRATVHQKEPDRTIAPIADHEVAQDPEFFMGGGGLCGVPGDYAAFMQMMLADGQSKSGKAVLKPKTVALMGENHIAPLEAGVIKIAMPNLSHDVDFFPGQRQGWGLSFLINLERSAEGRSPGSLSWGGLANTYFWIDPTVKIGGLMMTQVIPFADPAILKAYRAFERTAYEELAGAKAA